MRRYKPPFSFTTYIRRQRGMAKLAVASNCHSVFFFAQKNTISWLIIIIFLCILFFFLIFDIGKKRGVALCAFTPPLF